MKKQNIVIFLAMAAIVATGVGVFILSNGFNKGPLGTAVFDGNKELLWTHVVTNLLIGIAYMTIPVTLVYVARKAGKKIPFTWVFFAFGMFIVGCGLTHFMAVWTTWVPLYWLAQIINYATVVLSIGTAIAIIPLVPKIVSMVDSAEISEARKVEIETRNVELTNINKKFQEEINQRVVVQKELEDTKKALINVLSDKVKKTPAEAKLIKSLQKS